MTRAKRWRSALVGLGVLLCGAAPVQSQSLGVRGGFNINPDQIYVGGQYALGPLVERVWLQPSAELGTGNDATLLAINLDVTYRKPLQRNGIWTAYIGGGPAVNWYHLDVYSATDMGVAAVAGLMHSNGLFTDFKVGFLESPRFRVGVGYAFHRGAKTKPAAATPIIVRFVEC